MNDPLMPICAGLKATGSNPQFPISRIPCLFYLLFQPKSLENTDPGIILSVINNRWIKKHLCLASKKKPQKCQKSSNSKRFVGSCGLLQVYNSEAGKNKGNLIILVFNFFFAKGHLYLFTNSVRDCYQNWVSLLHILDQAWSFCLFCV